MILIGFGDGVRCFFCDGAVRNWDPEKDPLAVHAHFFPDCAFVGQLMEQSVDVSEPNTTCTGIGDW